VEAGGGGWRNVSRLTSTLLHVVYFAADPWIFHLKTTYPLYSSTVDLKCKEIIVYIEYQSFCPFVGIGSYPVPSKRVWLSRRAQVRGATHSLAGEGMGDLIPTKGQKLWYYTYTY
jgi:hypothetical protein